MPAGHWSLVAEGLRGRVLLQLQLQRFLPAASTRSPLPGAAGNCTLRAWPASAIPNTSPTPVSYSPPPS